MNEWISVKERLPDDEKDGETVLAVVSGKPHENITLCHALMTAGYFPEEGWVANIPNGKTRQSPTGCRCRNRQRRDESEKT